MVDVKTSLKTKNLPTFRNIVPEDHQPVRASASVSVRKAKFLKKGAPPAGPDLKVKVQKIGAYRAEKDGGGKRGKIRRFTFESRRKLQQVVRSTADLWDAQLTLTYPEKFPSNGAVSRQHREAFLAWLRRIGCAYMWVLEFQERGAPHYHFLIRGWVPRDIWKKDGREVEIGTPDAILTRVGLESTWYRIVGSGDNAHLLAGTSVAAVESAKQAGGYIAKHADKLLDYMSKLDQKKVPVNYVNVGRFWGCSRMLEQVAFKTEGFYRDVKTRLEPLRKSYEEKCAGWGFKWEWKGAGFVYLDGADLFTSMLRQAVEIDHGVNVWAEWDGRDERRDRFFDLAKERFAEIERERRKTHRRYTYPGGFMTLVTRMRREGQLTLDGKLEPTYPDLEERNGR